MTILSTPRLTLRELGPADAPFILELVNEPGWLANIGDRGVHDLAGARGYIIDGPAASYARHGFGLWRVGLNQGDEAIGICGLLKRDTLDAPDIGFAFLERWHGRGYAREAAQATMDHARDALGCKRVLATIVPSTLASARVLEAVGLTDAGILASPSYGDPVRLFAWAAP